MKIQAILPSQGKNKIFIGLRERDFETKEIIYLVKELRGFPCPAGSKNKMAELQNVASEIHKLMSELRSAPGFVLVESQCRQTTKPGKEQTEYGID